MTNRLGRRILPRQRDGVQDKRVGGANDWQGGPVEIIINKVASIVLKNAFSVCNRPTQACHPVSHGKWLALLQKQLERSLDEGITRLRQGGTRSVLFQVTLLAYGYTFLGKGTVRAFISDLTHEAAVYNRLSPLQGHDVPVFLGAIDLRAMDKIYYFVHRVYVVHMTFLSWGGDSLADALKTGFTDKNLQSTAMTALRAIHQEGVVHKDVLFSNMLFNREVKRVMMIDFERAVLVKPPRPPLAQLVPSKRQRKPGETECKKAATSSCNIRRVGEGFSKDILDAKMVFWDLDSRYGIAK
ncbi:Protein kinase-like domain protein, partial [Metarhizium majus ARSEF 297]